MNGSTVRMGRRTMTAALLLIAVATPALSQTGDGFEEIEVVGLRDPFRLTAKEIAAGLAVLRRERPTLAPNGTAYLEVTDATSAQDSRPLTLRLVREDGGEPIDISKDVLGRFPLPDVSTGYTLFTNRRNASAKPTVSVYSPGTSTVDRRVGDLLLECDVWWAMIRGRISFPLRTMLGNPCTSKHFGKYNDMSGTIAQAILVSANRTSPVEIARNRRRYRSPIYDKTIAADARVKVTLAGSD